MRAPFLTLCLALAPFTLALPACNISTTADGAFLNQLRVHCGEAFAGKIVSADAPDESWHTARIVMHIYSCKDESVQIALHVGQDRSRIWALQYEDGALALRHDHRSSNGQRDAVSHYGGAASDTSPNKISFPADQATKELFSAHNITASQSNIWTIEHWPSDKLFAYEITRPSRQFRIEFDTSKSVETPPAPWGLE